MLNCETTLWKTRANQHSLQEGNDNTKFFHTIANGRKRANGTGMINDDGVVYQTEKEKKNYFFLKFKELYNVDEMAPSSFGDWSGLFSSNRVSNTNIARLSETFSMNEIKQAVFQLGSDKTLGP